MLSDMPRTLIALNQAWKYTPKFEKYFTLPDYDDRDWQTVTIPHTNIETPYNYFDETMSQFVSCYRHTVEMPSDIAGKRVFLDFDGVMTYAEVTLNGNFVGSHKGGYTPFRCDVTAYVQANRPNVLAVQVDSREREDIPPFGGSIDYLTFGGIYREVTLSVVDPIYIDNVFARPQNVLSDRKQIAASVFLRNTLDSAQTMRLTVAVKDGASIIGTTVREVTLPALSHEVVEVVVADIANVKLWDVDEPNLYLLDVQLTSADGRIHDAYETRIGFRTAEFTPTGFLLNGRPLKLRGLNRHQTFPYVGQAMPARAQRKDADILKDELHLNLVRTSHYPQSKHFLDRCDEIGLLVLEEIPGWQHIGQTAEWKQVACENVREMIIRDWNHPAIILWGVRINESLDDHDFYTATNRIAHELDATRQTGGIRYLTNSELLEDVYTMNDFCHTGGDLALRDQRTVTGLERLVPYLVTECNGHMYPTKRFDQEERLIEHAMRHARIHNCAGTDENISGAIGWCAFDYNTHYNFGSGDRICYHGVMDMFRLPKMAAAFYRSQVAPACEPVLEPATIWARGERNIGGVVPLTIFTNCDAVDLFYGERLVGRYEPDRAAFPGLAYPPVTVAIPPEELGNWGMVWEDGRFVGYVNGQAVIEKRFVKDPLPTRLLATADDAELAADGIDTTRVVFRLEDQVGNLLPFLADTLKLTLTGPGDILGPTEIPLIGGTIAVWLRTRRTAGVITLAAKGSRLQANEVTIHTT